MFIETLVKALIPSIERNQVLEDIESTITEINDFTLPPYMAAFDANLFGETYNARSKWLQEKQRSYSRSGASRLHSVHQYIHNVVESLPERLEFFYKRIGEDNAKVIVADGIDYRTANLIQFISAAGYVAKYARKFLLLTYCHEMPEHVKKMDQELPFSKIELKMLEDQYDGFMELIGIFSMAPAVMFKKLDSVPEYVVDENDEEIIRTTGSKNLEPIAVGFVPYRFNPIYHVRMAIADYQHSRYLAAKDERQALDLRLLAMKAAKDSGVADPALNKQIKITDDRLMKLNRRIGQMENI